MNEELRALSVRQPWAWAICAGIKKTENRTWTTERRGTIAIHASTSTQVVNAFHKDSGCEAMHRKNFVFGAIIGFADIVDVASYGRQHEDDPFAEGPYCWTMGNGRFLKEPIPIPGKLNLFKLTPAIQDVLRAAPTFEVDLQVNSTARSIADSMTGVPDPIASYLELVDEFWRTNNHMDAMTNAANRLMSIAPDEPTGYITRAALRLDDAEATDCSELLRHAVKLAPEDPLAWFFLSEAYIKEGDAKKAIEAADQLMRLEPDNADALRARARAYFHANDHRRCIGDCNAALLINADNPVVLALRAEAKASSGDAEGAKTDIAEALRLDPTNKLLIELEQELVGTLREKLVNVIHASLT
jgi:ASCH domain/Tetratricopeptide repeat